MTSLLTVLLIVQLILGALLRHLNMAMMLHITGAVMVFLVAMGTGMRVLAAQPREPALRRLGMALLVVVVVQVLLGAAALVLRGSGDGAGPTMADVLWTTAHQMTGAALLAIATALTVLAHTLCGVERGTQPLEATTIRV